MIDTLLVMGAAWLLATAIGWVVTGLVDAPRRDALRPLTPIVGLAVAIVVLRWTAVGLGVDVGVWFVLGVTVVLAVVATIRDRRWWRTTLRALGWTLLVAAAAVVPAVITLGPSHAVGDSRVVQPNGNNDAFYYVATASWLEQHPATDVPVITADPTDTSPPPSYFPALSQLKAHLRIGQELANAALDVAIDHPAVDTWYPVTSLWILLLPTAGYGVALALRMRRLVGVALGAAAAVSAVTIAQLASQNSDALLGETLMPLAAVAVVASWGRQAPIPRWLAAVLFTAGLAVYPEYLPLVLPAMLVGLVFRSPRGIWSAFRRLLPMIPVVLVVGPFVVYDVVQSLLYLGGVASSGSAFDNVGSGAVLNRFLGTSSQSAPFLPSRLTPLLLALLAVGVLGGFVVSRRRWFVLTLAVWPPVLAYYLVEIAQPTAQYTQQRVVGLYVPLLMIAVGFGYDRLTDVAVKLGRERPALLRRTAALTTAAVGVVALGGFGLVNLRQDHRLDLAASAVRRHVDPSFADAAAWVREVGGPHGSGVDVLVGDFFDQLWMTDALREETGVRYPRLFPSYQGVQSYWTGSAGRYLLVDRQVRLAAAPALTIRSNSRFSLLDLGRGPVAALAPGDEFRMGNWFVYTNRGAGPRVTLTGRTTPDTIVRNTSPHFTSRVRTGELLPGQLTPTTTAVTVQVPPGGGRLFTGIQGSLLFVPDAITLDGATS